LNCGDSKAEPVTTYHEKKIDKTLYRITSVYLGRFELGKALDELIVKKILRVENKLNNSEDVDFENKK